VLDQRTEKMTLNALHYDRRTAYSLIPAEVAGAGVLGRVSLLEQFSTDSSH
jgi:hypothetical protein